VVTHAAIDYIRRQKHRDHEVLDEFALENSSYEDALPVSEDSFEFTGDKLSGAFSKLTDSRQQILTLIYIEGLTAAETAERLGCSVDYVYKQKHKALKRLRDQIIEDGGTREE